MRIGAFITARVADRKKKVVIRNGMSERKKRQKERTSVNFRLDQNSTAGKMETVSIQKPTTAEAVAVSQVFLVAMRVGSLMGNDKRGINAGSPGEFCHRVFLSCLQ